MRAKVLKPGEPRVIAVVFEAGEDPVRPTLEVILTQNPSYLARVHDAQSGLALIRLDR